MNFSFEGKTKSPGPFATFNTYGEFALWANRTFGLGLNLAALQIHVVDFLGIMHQVPAINSFDGIRNAISYLLQDGVHVFLLNRC
jgi:hypothetical protein